MSISKRRIIDVCEDVFIRQIFNKFGVVDQAGAAVAEELVYQGTIAGSPIVTYNAKIIYVALSLYCPGYGNIGAAVPTIDVYNELNALSLTISNVSIDYNAAQQYIGNCFEVKNIYFGRISQILLQELASLVTKSHYHNEAN